MKRFFIITYLLFANPLISMESNMVKFHFDHAIDNSVSLAENDKSEVVLEIGGKSTSPIKHGGAGAIYNTHYDDEVGSGKCFCFGCLGVVSTISGVILLALYIK
jgi:hypothetical protein